MSLLDHLLCWLNRPLCALSLHADTPELLTFTQKLEGWVGLRCRRCGRLR